MAADSMSAALRQVVRRYADRPLDAVKQAGIEFKRLGFQITDGASCPSDGVRRGGGRGGASFHAAAVHRTCSRDQLRGRMIESFHHHAVRRSGSQLL